jgi:hypothetical protein
MRILRFPRLVAAAALAVSMSLVATSSALAAGADVYAVGAGKVSLGGTMHAITFSLSAHTGPQGDFGTFKWTQDEDVFFPLEVRVDVDCVDVFPTGTGGGAWVQGQVKSVSPNPNVFGIAPGDENMIYLADNGNPGSVVADEINGVFFSIPPQICKGLGPSGGFPITQGNINIKLP